MAKRWKQTRAKAEKAKGNPRFSLLRARKVQAALGILTAISLAFAIILTQTPLSVSPFLKPQEPDMDFLGNVTIRGPILYEPTWNECTEDWRPQYEGYSCEEIRETFGLLPKVPRDLVDVSQAFFYGDIADLRLIQSDAWRQPEFYPGWTNESLGIQREPPVPMWTPFGYGFYPSVKVLQVPRTGIEVQNGFVEMRTLFYTGWGTDAWQGLHIYPVFPDKALKQDGTPVTDASGQPVTQEPSEVPFTVSIETASDDYYERLTTVGVQYDVDGEMVTLRADDERRPGGQFYILEPTHPRFPLNWVRLLTIRIEFRDLTPGIWFFRFDTANASPDVREAYTLLYGLRYVDAGQFIVSSATPVFQGFVIIT
jgi:hypothetical protein